MAAYIIRHGMLRNKDFSSNNLKICTRFASKKVVTKPSKSTTQRIEGMQQSLSSKGFLRSQKPYAPSEDVEKRLEALVKTSFTSKPDWSTKLQDSTLRFQFLSSCFNEFQHSIPNSILPYIETLGDVLTFYKTPVSTTTPLDSLKQMDLPANLHIQYEYHRFHPDTDTRFGGLSAYPKSSTIVTGLKYKKKYLGYKAKTSWP